MTLTLAPPVSAEYMVVGADAADQHLAGQQRAHAVGVALDVELLELDAVAREVALLVGHVPGQPERLRRARAVRPLDDHHVGGGRHAAPEGQERRQDHRPSRPRWSRRAAPATVSLPVNAIMSLPCWTASLREARRSRGLSAPAGRPERRPAAPPNHRPRRAAPQDGHGGRPRGGPIPCAPAPISATATACVRRTERAR